MRAACKGKNGAGADAGWGSTFLPGHMKSGREGSQKSFWGSGAEHRGKIFDAPRLMAVN